MSELKPCPFCGGKAKLFKLKANAAGTRFVYWVQCAFEGENDCHCLPKTCEFDNPDDAVNAWNIRFEDGSMCEWIEYDYRTMCPKEHGDVDNPYWRIPYDKVHLTYCPYCGKRIFIKQ